MQRGGNSFDLYQGDFFFWLISFAYSCEDPSTLAQFRQKWADDIKKEKKEQQMEWKCGKLVPATL
ncbi:unnamed protein product [Amoebophrya sp. A120]|nr:unnamed protein product [Amoebophrya sp. A120]|eukprot:GSA120T00026080001.1